MIARAVAGSGEARASASWIRPTLLFLAALVLCAVPFLVWTDIDLRIARWIWHVQGDRFQPPTGWFYPIYVGLRPLIYAIAGVVAALAIANAVWRRNWLGVDRRVAAFVLLSLALGPGLAVDLGLKDYWGRARPRDMVEFGGARFYTPPFLPTDQCADNCSFVSGHAALAFSLVTLAFLAPPRRRSMAFVAFGAFGLFVGAMRMLQGAHFLSDVLFAGFVVIGIAALLAGLVLRPPPSR